MFLLNVNSLELLVLWDWVCVRRLLVRGGGVLVLGGVGVPPCPGGKGLVMLKTSFSLGLSESMKDRAEGVISVTRSSRASTNINKQTS